MDNEYKLAIKDLLRLGQSMQVIIESLEHRANGNVKKFIKGMAPDLNVVLNKAAELDHHANKKQDDDN